MATNITNFNQQAMDQQMFITDMRQAQSTQRQTQLELRNADENDRNVGYGFPAIHGRQLHTERPTGNGHPQIGHGHGLPAQS